MAAKIPGRICRACDRMFTPAAPTQRTCSFRCARSLVPREEDDPDLPRLPKTSEPPNVEPSDADRSKRIAESLAEVRRVNAERLAYGRALAKTLLN